MLENKHTTAIYPNLNYSDKFHGTNKKRRGIIPQRFD